jgi:hypothetical protein
MESPAFALVLGLLFGMAFLVYTKVTAERRDRRRRTAEAFLAGLPLVHGALLLPDLPLNEFRHVRRPPTGELRDLLAAPADALLSAVVVDLTAGPLLARVPVARGRRWTAHAIGVWNDPIGAVHHGGDAAAGVETVTVALLAPGQTLRTVGPESGPYERLHARGTHALLLVAFWVDPEDAADVAAANALQDACDVTAYGAGRRARPPGPPSPAAARPPTPAERIACLTPAAFFDAAFRLLATNPAPCDAQLAALLALEDADDTAFARARAYVVRPGAHLARLPRVRGTAGWRRLRPGAGLSDAALAALWWHGVPAAAQFIADADDAGRPLTGAHAYRCRITVPGPEWSLTLYDARTMLLCDDVPRRVVRGRNPRLAPLDADGAVVLALAPEEPASSGAHWLPTPRGAPFVAVLRLDAPAAAVGLQPSDLIRVDA